MGNDDLQPDPSGESFQAPECHELSELLPAYKFTYLIACGGMGAVYKAEQLSLGRDVAIKVLPPELSKFEQFEQGFKIEARAMAQLSHVNLIGVYDFGEVAGMLYLVMEYIDGDSLHDATTGQVVDPIQAAGIVKGIAAGLGHAHAHDIVHRDIKPANILLSQKLNPKLGDFGLAVPADNVGAGMNMGTPGYVAPEILQNFESASPASDVFSLGMIFHELLTGINPTGEAPANVELVPNLRGLRLLISKAISPEPERRHANGEVFAKEIGKWLESAKKGSAPILTKSASTPSLTPAVSSWSNSPVSTKAPRKGVGGPIVGILALLALVAAAFILFGGKDEKPETAEEDSPDKPLITPRPEPSPPAPPVETFNLESHQDEVRKALTEASRELLVTRRDNVAAFLKKTEDKEGWKAYVDLIDHDRGLLPRFVTESDKVELDKSMVALVNQFAVDHQSQFDYRHSNAVAELHATSIASLRKGKVLPTGLSGSKLAWLEWLGLSPFDVLLRKPRGDWDLREGPKVDIGATLTIEGGRTVRIANESGENTGTLAVSETGELTIERAGEVGTWKLRWREPWLEGTDETGQRVRFRRKKFQFAASGAPAVTPPNPFPTPAPTPPPAEPDKPAEPPLTDARLASMRLLFRDKINVELGPWIKSYNELLAKRLKQAEDLKKPTAATQIVAEIERIRKLDWQRGYLTPAEVTGENPMPGRLADDKAKLERHINTTLSKLKADYLKKLHALSQMHEDNGTDASELEAEMEPFLEDRRIDLTKFYNAYATVEGWTKDHGKNLTGAAHGYQSRKGIKYDIRGILQLDSGTFSRRFSERMDGKKVSEHYDQNWPTEITGIPINQKANLVYLVGASLWGRASTGTTVANVILHYEDGNKSKLAIQEKIHLADWYQPRGVPKGSRIWRGGNDNGVYEIELRNPKPDRTIVSMDFVSGKEASAPFFIAVTLSD